VSLSSTFCALPLWLHDVFLGYGDVASVMNLNKRVCLDFCDTLIDYEHVQNVWSDKKIRVVSDGKRGNNNKEVSRPFRVYFPPPDDSERDGLYPDVVTPPPNSNEIVVEPYAAPKPGPYPGLLYLGKFVNRENTLIIFLCCI
jgi:hypothetical protein